MMGIVAAAFHVYVEGASGASPGALRKLAEAMSTRYGVPATDLEARLSRGRFRVKANVDRATADELLRDLEAIGARATIEDASAPTRPSGPLATQPARATTPPPTAARSTLPPPTRPGPSTPPAGTPYQSGLSAAFSTEPSAAASLGALEQTGGSFSLASLDGVDSPGGSAAPSEEVLAASFGPPQGQAPRPATPSVRPKDVPVDLFAPPDAEDAVMKMELADDELAHQARKKATIPPQTEPIAPAATTGTLAMRRSNPSIQPATEAIAAPTSSRLGPLADPRTRFAAGVVLSILIGFVPAHLVGRWREHSAYGEVDRKVIAAQEQALTIEAWQALDQLRASELVRKQSDQRQVAVTGLLVWALAGGGIGYLWFRRIRWDELEDA